MTRSALLCCCFALLAAPVTAPVLRAQEPTADQIVEMVQLSRAVKDKDIQGTLTKDALEVPFVVSLKPDFIRFYFKNPQQTIHLDLKEKGTQLREIMPGSNKPVPDSRYAEGIRGTDLSYDDISLRYLYWEKRVKQPHEETIKTRKCYVVDLYNPRKNGDYGVVRVYADKKSGGLMRVECYDWAGKKIKVCAVTSGMKIDGAMMLKSMDVIRYDAGTEKVVGETTFELSKS